MVYWCILYCWYGSSLRFLTIILSPTVFLYGKVVLKQHWIETNILKFFKIEKIFEVASEPRLHVLMRQYGRPYSFKKIGLYLVSVLTMCVLGIEYWSYTRIPIHQPLLIEHKFSNFLNTLYRIWLISFLMSHFYVGIFFNKFTKGKCLINKN